MKLKICLHRNLWHSTIILILNCINTINARAESTESVEPTATWQGLYFGGSMGGAINADNRIGQVYDLSNLNSPTTGPGAAGGSGGENGTFDGRSDVNDLFSGIYVGHNWQFNKIVAGVEGDIGAYASMDNALGSLRGRLGMDVNKVLLYGTAGLSYISIDGGDSAVFTGGRGGNAGSGGSSSGGSEGIPGIGGEAGVGPPHKVLSRDSASEFGFVGGIGAEYGIGPQTTLGLEILYYKFDNLAQAGFDDNFFMLRGRLSMGLDDNFGGLSHNGGSANWAGLYMGAHGGMLFNTANDTIDSTRLLNGGAGGNGANATTNNNGGGGGGGGAGGVAMALLEKDDISALGGVQLGYNWQTDRLVYGVETDGSFGSHNRDYLASLRAKLGWAYRSHLFYLTSGIAFTRVNNVIAVYGGDGNNGGNGNNSINLGGTGNGGVGGAGGKAFEIDNDENLVGFAIGAGIDTKLTRDISFGLEGIYYGFNGDTKTLNDLNISAPGSTFISQDDDRSTFVMRAKLATFF